MVDHASPALLVYTEISIGVERRLLTLASILALGVLDHSTVSRVPY
jgi:hypothetical protein